ncbi:Microtubule-nucleating Tub4p (gamma-tubulin) complex component [Dipsacomyces acuminosporus]|nr:Microtubule-nucleating Tub4p (gamma-tubulin) complex component [Dipsacomyces acuminosporus]
MSDFDRALYRYIDSFLGPPASDNSNGLARRDRLARYLRSIIESSISPAAVHDEKLLVSDVQKKLMASSQQTRSAMRVSRLYDVLKQQDPEQDWWPILYLLAECGVGGPQSTFTNSNYISDQANAYGIGNVFADQVPPPPPPVASRHHHHRHQAGTAAPTSATPSTHRQPYHETAVRQQSPSPAETSRDTQFSHRLLPTYDDISESALLQDLIYVMQGIDGSYVRWNPHKSAYTIVPDVNLSRPTRAMVASLSELGGLCKDIQHYIDGVGESGGLYQQSFCSELRSEMAQYFKLIAVLEAQLSKTPPTLGPGESSLGLTLRRLYAWTIEPRQKLRLMATAIGEIKRCKGGGDILSIISTLVDDGDPFIHSFSKRLLKTASVPFNDILVRWVSDGELVDPHDEFFIRERVGRQDMFWTEKYDVVPEMIPVHLEGEMTRKIFQIGRSLNFLRVACSDAKWVVESGPRTQIVNDISDPNALESFVYRSFSMVNARLMSVLKEKFRLMGHIKALRSYLLFEQGDFALALMEVLDNQLDVSGKHIMAHDLSAVLSSAVRSSNAQYEPQEYLSAMVLTFSEDGSKQKGWDEVSLMYSLPAPLSYVIPKLVMRQYFEISHFLLRLKRVEYSLHSIWRQQMTESRSYLRGEELRRRKSGGGIASTGPTDAQDRIRQAMRESEIACSEMVQFFHQVQRYISLNVIEGAWGEFLEATNAGTDKPTYKSNHGADIDIDKWSAAHSKYVKVIHDVVCGNGLGFQRNLSGIFDTAFQFIAVVKELYSERALSRRSTLSSPESRSSSLANRLQSLRGSSAASDPSVEHLNRVHTIVTRFKEQVKDIMRVLSHNAASDLQFLVVTIDYNEFYVK